MHSGRSILAAFLLICSSSAATTSDSESTCEFNNQQKLLGLAGKQAVGDPAANEYFYYESRVETLGGGVNRFLYCIKNGSKYQVLTIAWEKDDSHPYLRAAVAPQRARTVFMEEVDSGYEHAPRQLKFGDHQIEPHTVITPSDAASKENVTLRSGGTFDLPANDKVVQALKEGSYTKYSPSDFVTVALAFSSTKSGTADKAMVDNSVSLNVISDFEDGRDALTEWPRFLVTPTPGFAPFQTWSEKFMVPDSWPDGKAYATQTFALEGGATQRKGVLQISDGKDVLVALPVSYFAP